MALSLKLRVNTLLNKLGDRDTFGQAALELESISQNLESSSISTFLSCILATNSSDKPGVRRQCVKLISILAGTYPQFLPSFLPKILSHLLRRLRDPDSTIRSSCVDAVSALSANLIRCNFSNSFLKPLSEALFTEQEPNAQIGVALCLAAAIDGVPDPDPGRLGRMVPRLEKLVKCDGFKAKAAVLVVIGSVIGSGGVAELSAASMRGLVGCLMGFLSSIDWAARKAAAEALERLAMVERDSLGEYKTGCLKLFEARRFDKVKAVREVMNQMMEAWKQVPDVSEESSPPPMSHTSKEDASDGRYPPRTGISSTASVGVLKSRIKAVLPGSSTPPDGSFNTTARKRSPLKSGGKKTGLQVLQKVNPKKPSDQRVEVAPLHASSYAVASQEDPRERSENVTGRNINDHPKSSKPEITRAITNKSSDDKIQKFGGLKLGSRVVPCHEDNRPSIGLVSSSSENIHVNHQECEDLSLIRSQLVQIEQQQSSLLDLLQKFIGSSETGMHSLETRVHGLELALDEISYDLAVSTGRMPSSHRSSCCLLPGADFFSPKIWRKTDGRYSFSRFLTSGGNSSLSASHYRAGRMCNREALSENHRLQLQGGGRGFIVNPLAEIRNDSRGNH